MPSRRREPRSEESGWKLATAARRATSVNGNYLRRPSALPGPTGARERERTHELDPQPRESRRIPVPAPSRRPLTPGLYSQQTDRDRERDRDGQQHRCARAALPFRHCRRSVHRGHGALPYAGALPLAQGSGPGPCCADGDPGESDGDSHLLPQHHGVRVNEIFWGLWLIPFGILVFRSRFLPRILGVWLILNSLPYLATSVTGLLSPQYESTVWNIGFPLTLGELAIMLWLLIKGAKPQPLAAPA